MSVQEECYIGPYIKVEPKTILVERQIRGCQNGHRGSINDKFCSKCGEIIAIFNIKEEAIENPLNVLDDTGWEGYFTSIELPNTYIPNYNYSSVFWGVEEGDISSDIIEKEMLLFYINYEDCLNFMKNMGIVFEVKFGFIKYYN